MTTFLRSVYLLCALLAFLAPAYAADENQVPPAASPAPALTVRAGVHPDFDRLVVDWPRHVAYAIHRDGAHVTVNFNAAGQASWQDVIIARLSRMGGFISSADKEGHLSISFTVNPNATIKDFTSGDSVVVDITGSAVGASAGDVAAVSPTTAATSPTPALSPAPTTSSAPKPEQATIKTPEKVTDKPAEKLPEKPADPTPPPLASAPPTPVAAATPAPSPPPALPLMADIPKTAPLAEVTDKAKPSLPLLSPTTTPAKPVSFPDITDKPLLIASLDPHTPMRTVVYQRGGFGYIVFDRKITLTLDNLIAGQPAPLIPLEAINLINASGYRLPVPPNVEIRATRTKTVWQIFLTRQQPDVPVSASLIAQPDFALGSRFLLPLPDAPDPVRLTDPVVGDDLVLVPMEQTQAFSVARKMADFEILPAAQGIVIKSLTEKLIVRAVTDGIEITAEGGLHLSSSNDTGSSQESSQKARAAAAGKSMFDFADWTGKPNETFTLTRQRLQQTIVDVPENERNRARLELARFYFAHGNGEEAAALLAYLVKLVPDISAHADFRVIDGAAHILAWHAEDGLKSFDSSMLSSQPEVELWQAVAYAELRDWKSAEEKFAITEDMLNGYPEPFYSRFSVLAVEAALAEGKDREAADWLDRLEAGHHRDAIEPAIEYLHGILDAKSGHAEKAEQAWKDVATANDNLYRVRAKMALIDLGISTHSLTPAQAADQLESLRFAWRGDDLELDILHRLGEFYVQAHNVKAGLNTLSRAVQLYPNSTMTPGIREEMAGIFRDIFLNDPGNTLSPLDALTLYQQYRSLMPAGTDGIAVMRNLAERLVQIDLLDQAGSLLEDLVKSSLQGEDKGRVSTRLAAIRLLDHKPDEALQALDLANSTNYPTDLQNERTFLRARALSEQQKYDEALALIKDNNAQPAKLLRADITMHAKRWNDAARALLDMIGPAPPAGTSLTSEQASWLVNCAIAVSMANDIAGLDKLRNDYTASIASLPQNDTFRMLTEPEKSEESRDIAAAQSRITDVDMFQGFLDTYRQSAAPSPTPPPTATTPASVPAPAAKTP